MSLTNLDQRILVFSDSSSSVTGRWAITSTGTGMPSYITMSTNDTEPSEGSIIYDHNDSKVVSKTKQRQDEVTAEFYFNHVKSSLTKAQKEDLAARMKRLTFILDQAPGEQLALREEMQKQLAVVYLQQQAAVLGFDTWVSKSAIDTFRRQVEFKQPELVELKNFSRVIPTEPLAKLKIAKDAKLFDSYWILTWNPKAEQLSTVTDRIIKKDPILFGQFDFDPEVYYFISDWVDETCDLTLSEMVDNLHQLHPEYEVGQIKPLTAKDMQFLVEQARARHSALQNTNPSRWKGDATMSRLAEEKFSFALIRKVAKALWIGWRSK